MIPTVRDMPENSFGGRRVAPASFLEAEAEAEAGEGDDDTDGVEKGSVTVVVKLLDTAEDNADPPDGAEGVGTITRLVGVAGWRVDEAVMMAVGTVPPEVMLGAGMGKKVMEEELSEMTRAMIVVVLVDWGGNI
ncbi:MAG: hypothetical protein M1823_004890 [Watsoniomyces obsoletus]|nr:MAG: hypothetical protein M1823_004890 [Watsoniomyces obsoletus]